MAIKTSNAPDISPPRRIPGGRPARRRVLLAATSRAVPRVRLRQRHLETRPVRRGVDPPERARRFQRIVGRVLEPSGLAAGRILLLLGESGCGKTHLMRAFRNQVHSRGSGYCGYLQMTAFTDQYGRYVLNNLIDSLDKPYDESAVRDDGADAALERPGRVVPGRPARPTGPAPRAGARPGEHRPTGRPTWPTGSSSTTGSASIDV